MSIFINNKKILGTEPSISPGDLGLFAGPSDVWYVKKSDGTRYALGSGSASSITSVDIIGDQIIFTEANGATFGASGSLPGGNISMSFSNEILSLQDYNGNLTASIPNYVQVDSSDIFPSYLFDKFIDGDVVPVKVTTGSYSATDPKIKLLTKSITFSSRYTGSTTTIPVVNTGVGASDRGFPILGTFNGTTYDGWTVVSDNFGGAPDTPTLEDRYFGAPYPINGEGITGTGSNCVFVLTDGNYNIGIRGSMNLGPGFTASGIVAYRLQLLSSNLFATPTCIVPLTREPVSPSSNSIESGLYFSAETKGLKVDTTLTGCGGAGGGGRFLLRILNITGGDLFPSAFDVLEIIIEKVG